MTNSERFINAFVEIENIIKPNGDFNSSFVSNVKSAKSSIVKQYFQDLISFANLRNAIIHNPRIGGVSVIAEPHIEIVERIEKIRDRLKSPPNLNRYIKNVIGAKWTDYLKPTLEIMRRLQISQIPILDDNNSVEEIITTNSISMWLSDVINFNNEVLEDNITLSILKESIEFKNNFEIISRSKNIFDARDLFLSHLSRYKRLPDALFITESGNKSKSVIGVITYDELFSSIYEFDKN